MKSNKEVINTFQSGRVIREIFDNGATFIFHPFKGLGRACFTLTFKVGSIDEKPQEYGLAHLLEHLIFKSARRHPQGNLILMMETLGAEINAYTSKEHTCFELTCNKKNLAQILKYFLMMFETLHVNEKDFQAEKKIVLHEMKEDLGDSELFAEEYFIEKQFSADFGHSIAGDLKTVKKLTLSQAKSFFKKFYTARRMIIALVASDLDKTTQNLLINYIGLYKKKAKPYKFKMKKAFNPVEVFKASRQRNCEQPYVIFGFSAPSLKSKDKQLLVILDQILNDGMSSLLFKATREENSLSYGLDTSINSFFESGHYLISGHTNLKLIPRMREVIVDVMTKKLPQALTQENIDREKFKLLDYWDIVFDDAEERLDYLMKIELFSTEWKALESHDEKFKKISCKQVQEFHKKMMSYGMSELIIKPPRKKG